MGWKPNKEEKSIGLSGPWATGGMSGSGVPVTDDTALANSAFYACVRVLSQTMGSLPINLYKIDQDGKKTKINHSRSGVTLTKTPNARQTISEMIEQGMVHAATDGNFIAVVTKNKKNEIISIQTLESGRQYSITELQDNTIQYTVTLPNGVTQTYPSSRILHIKNMAYSTYKGIDVVHAARSTLGLSIAATNHAETFYSNGSRAGGYLTTDKTMSQDAQTRLIQNWEGRHGGVQKAHKVSVLEEGMKFTESGIDLQKSQLIESRKYSVMEICSMLGVPASLIGHMEGATFNNVEELNRFFYNSTIGNWIKKFEDRINLMLPRDEYIEFDVSAFLKSDPRSTAEVGKILFETSSLTVNENRVKNGLEPIDGGDVIVISTNNTTLGNLKDISKVKVEVDDKDEE